MIPHLSACAQSGLFGLWVFSFVCGAGSKEDRNECSWLMSRLAQHTPQRPRRPELSAREWAVSEAAPRTQTSLGLGVLPRLCTYRVTYPERNYIRASGRPLRDSFCRCTDFRGRHLLRTVHGRRARSAEGCCSWQELSINSGFYFLGSRFIWDPTRPTPGPSTPSSSAGRQRRWSPSGGGEEVLSLGA